MLKALRGNWYLAAALLFGLAAAMLTQMALRRASLTVPVVVARSALAAHAQISENMVEVRPWPAQGVYAGMLSSPAEAVRRFLVSPVAAGEPVTRQRLSQDPIDGSALGELAPGMGAMLVPLADGQAPTQLLAPGRRITLIYVADPRAGEEAERGLLLKGLPILAVARSASNGLLAAPDTRGVVVGVDPAQQVRLATALAQGKVYAVVEGRSGEEVQGP